MSGFDNQMQARQARTAAEAEWLAQFVGDPTCRDQAVRSVALAFAQAIREARPVVTLPPHIFIPFKAKPWRAYERRILDGTAGTNSTGATEAGTGEGITVTAEATNYTDLATIYTALTEPRLRTLTALDQPASLNVTGLADALHLPNGYTSNLCAVLYNLGLLDRDRQGRDVYYRINRTAVAPLADYLNKLAGTSR